MSAPLVSILIPAGFIKGKISELLCDLSYGNERAIEYIQYNRKKN